MITKPVVLFDGICNLCNSAVQFIIRHDKNEVFLFCALQSEKGQGLLAKYKLPNKQFNSFILVDNNKVYQKSNAALQVLKKIPRFTILFYLLVWIPKFLRNLSYDFIAKNRYRWFGKKESCMVPTPEILKRFL